MSTNKAYLLEQIRGYLIGSKASVEATPAAEGWLAYATDTNEFGSYSGSVWTWGQGGSSFPNPFALPADITPAAIGADQNDYNPTGLSTADILRLTCDPTNRTITGLQGGTDGRVIVLMNIGGNTITLASQSSSSSAANRFSTGGDVKLYGGRSVALIYDATEQYWKPFSYLTNIATDNPLPLGTASPGSSPSASAADHIHPHNGEWRQLSQAWTYASGDDPVFQVYVTGDVSGHVDYQAGRKVKCSNNSTTFYGFIVKQGAYDSGNNRTPIDLYGGTDYDLANSAITDAYVSKAKSPDDFPLNPDKWTVSLSDTSSRSQASPSAATWYNPGGGALSLAIPIGVWRVFYEAVGELVVTPGAAANFGYRTTLSTANNSESDAGFTARRTSPLPAMTGAIDRLSFHREKILNLTSKTTYYLNISTGASGVTSIAIRGDDAATVIKCICSYL